MDAMPGDKMNLRLSFEGVFDLDAALRTAGQLEGAVQGALVTLDFARCAQVNSAGLARLSETIARCGGKVELHGLSRHDLRLLHYLVGSLGVTHAPQVDAD